MVENLIFPLQFEPQFAEPISKYVSFDTYVEMQDFIVNSATSPLAYSGQLATCKDREGIIYILNDTKTEWLLNSGGLGTNYDYWTAKFPYKETGLFYNWYAFNGTSPLTVSGWRVPTITDWEILVALTGYPFGTSDSHARSELYNLGFNTFPDNTKIIYWSSTDYSVGNPWVVEIGTANDAIARSVLHFTNSLLIRAIKETTILDDGEESTYTGNDGVVYRTKCFGTQEWLIENLRETKYRDGSSIDDGPYTDEQWDLLTTGAYGTSYRWPLIDNQIIPPVSYNIIDKNKLNFIGSGVNIIHEQINTDEVEVTFIVDPVSVPVTSVNEQIGDVVIVIPDVPVTSINTLIGDVVLTADEIAATATNLYVTPEEKQLWNNPPTTGIPYTGANANIDFGANNFTVDTDTLFVDSINHRVGVNTIVPGADFEVNGNSYVMGGNGDINGSGAVSALDVLYATYHLGDSIALTPAQYARGDVLGNGLITAFNRTLIQYAVGFPTWLPTNLMKAKAAQGRTAFAYHPSDWTGTDFQALDYCFGWNVSWNGPTLTVKPTGKMGVGGLRLPTAMLHLPAGIATTYSAPLKFTSGINLTDPESGAMEWDGTNLFITQTSGPTRKTIAYTTDISGADFLKLDQTTPQTVINGKPTFSDGLKLGTSPTIGTFAEGKIYYDNVSKTPVAEIGTATSLQIGQQLFTRVYNNTGTIILKGSACKIQSSTAGRIETSLAIATGYTAVPFTCTGGVATFTLSNHGYTNTVYARITQSSNPTSAPLGYYPIQTVTQNTFEIVVGSGTTAGTASIDLPQQVAGLAAEDIQIASYGFLLNKGILTGLIANTLNVGDIVYLSGTIPGGYVANTSTLTYDARSNQIGYVIQAGTTTGQLYVEIRNENINRSLTDIEANVVLGNTISTGIYQFTGIIVNGVDPTHKIDIPPIKGWIANNTDTFAVVPWVINVVHAGQTGVTLTNLASSDFTYFLIDKYSQIYQQTTFPTPEQRRDNIFLGKVVHPNRTTILTINNTVDYDTSPMSALRDMFSSIPLMNDGVTAYPNGANLNFNTSGGTLIGMGINWSVNQKEPNTVTAAAAIPRSFFYRTQLGGLTGIVSNINPAVYDLNGVITTIPTGGDGTASRTTNQRIFMYATGIVNVQYGQQYYNSLALALAGQQTETFNKAPATKGAAVLIGILAVRRAATDLSNASYAIFTPASMFGESVGGVNGISTTSLQQAYNNSVVPNIITNTTLGALTLQRGSTADTDSVFEVRNGATNVKFSVTGEGLATAVGLTVDTSTLFVDPIAHRVGIGELFPTAALHLKAGAATTKSAPLKFTTGVNQTVPEAGTFEYDGTNLYFTPIATRKTVAYTSDIITYTVNPDTIATDTKEPTGFMLGINWGLASVAVVTTTKLQLTIPVTSGSISNYWRGVKSTFAGPMIVTSTEDKSEGIWYCYTTDGTNYIVTKTPFYISTVVAGVLRHDMMVWEFYWDNTNNVTLWLQPEIHGIIMDGRTHYHNHETFGTRYISGLTATFGTLPATTDINKRIKLSSGELHDEDISAFINHSATPTLLWEQSLGSAGTADANYAQLPIYYRSGSDASFIWRKMTATSYPFSPITNNVAFNYNRLNAGTWDYTTPSGNNNYWNAFIVGTTNQAEPIIVIPGRIVSSTLSTVQAEGYPNLAVEGLCTEYKYLYRLIYRNNTTTAGKASLISVTDLRLDSVSNNTSQSVSLSASQVPVTPAGTITSTNVQAALEELDTLKAPVHIQVGSLTLISGSWTLVSGLYEYDLANANILSTSIVDVIPDNANIAIVKAADILPKTVSSAGSVKLYATNAPTGNIGVTINIY